MCSLRLLASGWVLAGTVLLVPSQPAARLADPVLLSTWRHTPITIDGAVSDWTKLDRVDRGPPVALQNDAGSLYLAVAASEPEVRQQLATGLVVWFDPKSRKEQGSGLRIPGMVRRSLPGAAPEGPAADAMGRESSARTLDQFDWLGPSKSQRKLVDLTPAIGVAIASGTAEGVLAYEISLPLRPSTEHPYAVDAAPGSTIEIGFETPSDPPMHEGRGTGGGMSGRGGGTGGPRGGAGGHGGSPGGGVPPRQGGFTAGQSVKPMRLVWVSVKLASAD